MPLEIVGIIVFALGILVSVSLHEAGHMGFAKAFGMKVSRYFVGFGPTLWSFRKGETEYGIKAIPLGGFCKIDGMTPQDDDMEPGEEHRAFFRFPVWKRTVVLAAGSVTHFVLGLVILWVLFAFIPRPDMAALPSAAPVVDQVSPCVTVEWKVVNGQQVQCDPNGPQSPAKQIGLQKGDLILAVGDQQVSTWDQTTTAIRASGGSTTTITYKRNGQTVTSAPVTIPKAARIKDGVPTDTAPADINADSQIEHVGQLGITAVAPTTTSGPIDAIGQAGSSIGSMFKNTFVALGQFPEKVPKLFSALTGAPRDPGTPVSVVGASRIGGELFQQGDLWTFLALMAALNLFVGVFNLFPLLPLDGGHIAIAQFEKARAWVYAKLRKPDPGRVDYYKLMPLTYAVILLFGGLTVLTIAADVINPITLFNQ